jgi:Glycosyltransferase family 87
MLLLHVFLAWRSRGGVYIGLPDFSIFYTAAEILHQGRGPDLYDDRLQENVQLSFSPIALEKRGSALPFNHPPFEALVFAPFAHLSYLGAYLVWFGIDLGLVIVVLVLLRKTFAILGSAPFYLWMLAGLGFYPVFVALLQGQDSIFVLFCYTIAFLSFRRGREFREGAWVGLGLCKFHLVLPFVFPLLVLDRRKFIAGFLLVAVVLALLGLSAVGWKASLGYPAYVWAGERNQSYAWALLGHVSNVRGLVESLCPPGNPRTRTWLILVICLMLLTSLTYAVRKAFLMSAVHPELVFALSLIATALTSYHIYFHDLSILLLAVLIVLEFLLSSEKLNRWGKRALYGCIGILFCSPVYMLLTMRYKHSELLGAVLLIFFVVLLVEFLRMQLGSDAQPAPVLTNPELH